MTHPARFLLVGTMNPEEGELRPQLADRIGLDVEVEPLVNVTARAEVIRRREAFTDDPAAFALRWQPRAGGAARAGSGMPGPAWRAWWCPTTSTRGIAGLGLRIGAASHRADITVLQCAKALAALAGREVVELVDVVDAGELALGHRLPLDPFAPAPDLTRIELERALEDVLDAEVAGKATRRAAGPALRPAPG